MADNLITFAGENTVLLMRVGTPLWNSFFSYVQPPVTDYKWALLSDGTGLSKR